MVLCRHMNPLLLFPEAIIVTIFLCIPEKYLMYFKNSIICLFLQQGALRKKKLLHNVKRMIRSPLRNLWLLCKLWLL